MRTRHSLIFTPGQHRSNPIWLQYSPTVFRSRPPHCTSAVWLSRCLNFAPVVPSLSRLPLTCSMRGRSTEQTHSKILTAWYRYVYMYGTLALMYGVLGNYEQQTSACHRSCARHLGRWNHIKSTVFETSNCYLVEAETTSFSKTVGWLVLERSK
jgi:hypothetical protein